MVVQSLENAARSSKLTIINGALALLTKVLAESAPASYEDATNAWERDIARLYDDEYDAALQAKPWPSAQRRIVLTANAADQLDPSIAVSVTRFCPPSDFLRLVRIEAGGNRIAETDFEVVGQFIEMQGVHETISIRYISRVAEHELLQAPLLRAFISARLAFRAARNITNSAAERGQIYSLMLDAEAQAWSAETGHQGASVTRSSRTLGAMAGLEELANGRGA